MKDNKNSNPQEDNKPGKGNKQDLKGSLKEASHNPAVKDALKKEKQPVTPEDLSPLHNNRETGTSGGDQRVSENELKEGDKLGEA